MLFSWLKSRRRRRIADRPFPQHWNDYLASNVRHDRLLPAELKARLRAKTAVFVAEKNWEGCGGLTLTEEIKVTIAAQACLLLLGSDNDFCFDRVMTVLVHRGPHLLPPPWFTPGGRVVRESVNSGEAWQRGPVLLSWSDVSRGGGDPGEEGNLVIHEFAHKLDELNGEADGTPPLEGAAACRRWEEIAGSEFEKLRDDVRQGKRTVVDDYGATSRAEFFACASEAFFEKATQFKNRRARLYGLLADFYRLDPAAWFDRPSPDSPPLVE